MQKIVYTARSITTILTVFEDKSGKFFTTVTGLDTKVILLLFRPTDTFNQMCDRIELFLEIGWDVNLYRRIVNNSQQLVGILENPNQPDKNRRRIANTRQAKTMADADKALNDAGGVTAYITVPPKRPA